MEGAQSSARKLLRTIKTGVKSLTNEKSRVTLRAKLSALPDYIIVGAQRAGTTSLYSYLNQHPQILHASEKEVHYFDINYERGMDWYRNHFPIAQPGKQSFITGEASPYYLFHPHCADRIRKAVPDVKIIALLRNPAKRAISHYFHEVGLGWERLSIEEALRKEDERIGPELAKMRQDPLYYSPAYQHFSYQKRGLYLEQVRSYLNLFDPRQVLVLEAEDLFARPQTALGDVYRFLGVDSNFVPRDLRRRNKAKYSEKVPEATYKYLVDYFRPHNEQLSKHLNRSFNWQ